MNRQIINVLASSIHITMFLKSRDTSGQITTRDYTFTILKDVIQVRQSNVVQDYMVQYMIENTF